MKRKRKLKKVQRDQVRSRDYDDPLVQKVITSFENKKSAKQIANEIGVDLPFVYGVKNKFCRSANNNSIPIQEEVVETAIEETPVTKIKEVEEIKEEENIDIENTATKKKRLSADEIETFAVLYLEGNEPEKIAKITGRHISSVYRGLTKYQSIDPTFKFSSNKNVKTNKEVKPIVAETEKVIERNLDLNIYKKHRKLTEKGIRYVLDKIAEGVPAKDIANDLFINRSTVYNVITKYSNTDNYNKEVKFIEEKKKEEKFNITTIIGSKMKTVGLIYGRHEEIPATEFIFHEVSSNLMFDYSKQEKLCREYIASISKEGYTSLQVYVTGLPCIAASLSKVAIEENFDLILKHYDKKTETYKDQRIVTSDKATDTSSEYSELLSIYNKINIIEDTVNRTTDDKFRYLITLGKLTNGEYNDTTYICHSPEVIKELISNLLDYVLGFDTLSGEVSIYRLDYNDNLYKVGMKVI